MNRNVELVSTGSELLDGRRLNTHARLIGTELTRFGLRLIRDTTVPDDPDGIREAIESALKRVDLVFVTGGLGPTSDDLTRDIIGAITSRRVVMHEPTLAKNNEWLKQRNRKPNESFDRHALMVEGAIILENRAGLAAGERIEFNGRNIILLPGPPAELRAIMDDHVLPWLSELTRNEPRPLVRNFVVCGMGESDIAVRAGSQLTAPELEIAYCAQPGKVELRLMADPKFARIFSGACAAVRAALAENIITENDGSEEIQIERVVGDLLKARGLTLAVAESCTGGLIGNRITNIAGSSDYFRGGCIAYSNEIKIAQLGVDPETLAKHGAVSEPVARQMAEGARRAYNADIALATTGIAGPTGGTPAKPVGLVFIAVADARGTVVREIRTGGSREYVKNSSAQAALDYVRRRLQGFV